jgi:hypothetical protein
VREPTDCADLLLVLLEQILHATESGSAAPIH